jgi:hypothetical protein
MATAAAPAAHTRIGFDFMIGLLSQPDFNSRFDGCHKLKVPDVSASPFRLWYGWLLGRLSLLMVSQRIARQV